MFPKYYLEENDAKINRGFPFNLSTHVISSNIPPHGHNFLELHYVFEGHGIEIINGFEYNLEPGTIACVLPHQIHEMHISSWNQVSLFNFGISLKFFFESENFNLSLSKLLFDIDLEAIPLYLLNEATANKVHTILNEMLLEYYEAKAFNQLLFRSKLVELLIIFYRFQKSIELIPSNINPTFSKKGDIWTIVHFVYVNYREDLNLKILSKKFNLSVPYISSNFKNFLGVNFHTFLRTLRIEHACSLLTSSNISISDIAYEVGYQSYSTFIRVFESCKGIAPTAYRKIETNKKASF